MSMHYPGCTAGLDRMISVSWIGQLDPVNPVHFTAYALHDLGPAKTDDK